MFILAAWIQCFVYISRGLVTRGYFHCVFIIFVLESMVLQVVQIVLLLVFLLLVDFGDADMYDGAVSKRDQVSIGLTLVVDLRCSGCLMFVGQTT